MKIEKSEVEYFFQNLENGDILETDGKMYMIVKKIVGGYSLLDLTHPLLRKEEYYTMSDIQDMANGKGVPTHEGIAHNKVIAHHKNEDLFLDIRVVVPTL